MNYFPFIKRFSFIWVSLISAVLLVACNYQYISAYVTFPLATGFDTSGHVAIGEYYTQHIFPKTWGWVPAWLGGMPFPQFYPPLFYFLTALLSKIFFISYGLAFKSVVLALFLGMPGVVVWLAHRVLKDPIAELVTGVASVMLLSTDYGLYGIFGVTAQGTFQTGLVTQLLGFFLLFLWLGFLLRAFPHRKDYYFSVIFLALVLVANTHATITAGLILIVYALVEGYRRRLEIRDEFRQKKYSVLMRIAGLGLWPLGLAAFWYVPLFSRYDYIAGKALGVESGIGSANSFYFATHLIYLIIFTLVALYIARKKHNESVMVLALASLVIFILIIVPLDRVVQKLPIHTYRSLPFFLLASAITAGYVYVEIKPYVKNKILRYLLPLAYIFVFVLVWTQSAFSYVTNIYTQPVFTSEMKNIVDYMKDKTGRINIESFGTGRPLNYYLTRDYSENPALSNSYAIFVESSINSGFLVPFKNSVSQGSERYAVDSLLTAYELKPQLMNIQADRARLLGISYFLISSPQMKKQFDASPAFKREKVFDTWNLYTLQNVQYADVLSYEPAILFSPVSFKGMHDDDLGYAEFQQLLLLWGDLNTVVAEAHNHYLDTSPDLALFKTAIITEYKYRNLEQAYKRLEIYSRTNMLIIVKDLRNPLSEQLSKLNPREHHIVVFDHGSARTIMWGITRILNNRKQLITSSEKNLIQKVSFTPSSIHIDAKLERSMPVVIKTSFFPDWKRTDGKIIYMATPGYMLAFADKDFDVVFSFNIWILVGYLISLVSLILLGINIVKRKH
jgi:hypothetical protein